MATALEENRYVLTKENSEKAIAKGLAEATWYTSPVPKAEMRKLLERRDGPAVRDTILWFALLIGTAAWASATWGTWWCVIPFILYGVFYATAADSRWHEAGHGTAFKTDWMNNVVYEIASFMMLRESTVWRWSHTRHHSDTIIVGRDPEIAVPRPPDIQTLVLNLFALKIYPKYFAGIIRHSFGRMSEAERQYVPESEFSTIFFKARIHLLIYLGTIALAIHQRSVLPLMFIGMPNLYGSWLTNIYGLTQHAGLAENVLDHRLNCRTVYMNRIHRYLYWNMNYHVEHHMFPLVPYHNLPRLHEIVKPDMPEPYRDLIEAWREIIPAVLRQVKDPAYHVKRKLPTPTNPREAAATAPIFTAEGRPVRDGWLDVCDAGLIEKEDVIRFDHDHRTFAIYRTLDNEYYATDGICTHGNTHLADGFVKGRLIECPKHNGRFDITDGAPKRPPVCVALRTYPVKLENGRVHINVQAAGGERTPAYTFRVKRNDNVATFIKELVLEPIADGGLPVYKPGQYMQLDIPAYGERAFTQIDVKEPFAAVWRTQHVYDFKARNETAMRRNYSLATNPATDRELRFNVRIATPPRGQDCDAGAGSTYVHALKPGDTVTAIGPFGEFLIKDTQREMIYLGGGAGMAPLRSHLAHLFETQQTKRTVSFWYGARSLQELYYRDYFEQLAARAPNFTFHAALSEPLPEDGWTGPTGNIHDILREHYLANHPNLAEVEFYLCGPPAMMQAARRMLMEDFSIAPSQIAYDEF
ncbi:MAG TPA: NADH:ubiquinone reductase (Na(+)-transporting) subunit F [Kiritimatiellia bacterium]|nr:NADH:ubiquinone reductase (Na(+)-transporting) subunit F [Kiritimatiellia bacterium]